MVGKIEETAEDLYSPDKDKQQNPEVSEQEAIEQTQGRCAKTVSRHGARNRSGYGCRANRRQQDYRINQGERLISIRFGNLERWLFARGG